MYTIIYPKMKITAYYGMNLAVKLWTNHGPAVFAGIAWLAMLHIGVKADDAKWLGVPTPEERQAVRQKAAAAFIDLGVGSLPLVGPARTDYPDIQGAGIHQ